MRTILCLTAVLLACTKPVAPEANDASVPGGGAFKTGSEALDGGALTPAKLDAWLGYQRQMMMMAKSDAGALGRARLERAARLDAGLSEDDIDRIEDLVAAVVTGRNLLKLTGGDALREFEQATASLTPAQRAQAQKAMADLKAKAQQTAGFEAERAKFGADVVNAVMAREAEATKTYEALVEAK